MVIPLCTKVLTSTMGCCAHAQVDPLFQRLAASFMAHVQADFGDKEGHGAVTVYAADGFFSDVHTPWLGTASGMPAKTLSAAAASIFPPHTGLQQKSQNGGQPLEWWRAHSAAVYESIRAAEPDAIWLYQTYPWHQFMFESSSDQTYHPA